eukprot:SM000030S11309  [mRNA]  locus=s30:38326:38832:+ [translate_table: standard]
MTPHCVSSFASFVIHGFAPLLKESTEFWKVADEGCHCCRRRASRALCNFYHSRRKETDLKFLAWLNGGLAEVAVADTTPSFTHRRTWAKRCACKWQLASQKNSVAEMPGPV